MTLNDVKNYWMRIATTNKAREKHSLFYGRPKTGAKGIGRFASRRLGTHLKLITIAQSSNKNYYEKTEIEFSWDNFKSGGIVTEIECLGRNEKIPNTQTGTTLIISEGKKNEWKKRGYDYVKRQLALLVVNRGTKRKGFKEDPGFNIYLSCPQMQSSEKAIDLREQFISSGWGVLTGEIDNKGTATYQLDGLGIGIRTFTISQKFPNLKSVSMKIGIIPSTKKDQLRNPKLLASYVLNNVLPEWGGVQVRYKGFRIYPYGDDDWLEIDKDRGLSKVTSESDEVTNFAYTLKVVDPKRYLLSLLSMRSYVGAVNIGEEALGFEPKASREGFVNSDSVNELKNFVRFGIDWATALRDYYIRIKAKDESEIAIEKLEKLTRQSIAPEKVVKTAINYLNQQIDEVTTLLPKKEKQELEKSLLAITNAILKYDKSKEEELHHLRLVASTSTLLSIFAHEVKSLGGFLNIGSHKLKMLEKRLSPKDAEFVKEIQFDFEETKKRFSELLEMTSLVGADSRDAIPKRLALFDKIESAEKCFQLITKQYGITIDYKQVPKNLLVGPLLEGELYAVLLNTLSNSVKSVIAGGSEKKIEFSATSFDRKVMLNIRDTGIGIEKEHYEHVFTPFVADPSDKLYSELNRKIDPADKYIVGMGTGLGLSIVRDIVYIRKGTVRFVSPTDNWSADLEIILP